jgi:tape measure domain-containing protein
MANDVVIRFISQDNASATANKVAVSIDGVDKSATKAKNSSTDLGGALGGIGGKIAGITAVGGAMVATGTKIFEAATNAALLNDKFENVRKSLGLMTGSATAGNELFNTMEKLAARTPYSFDDIAQGTQKLLAMGFAAKEIPGLMTTIGDTAAATGTGADGVNRITLALGQMQAKGKVTTEEMMQLQELGVPAFRILADATGVSQEALMDMVTKGIIPADQNLQTLIDGMKGEYGGMMASQMNTATQAQANFQDATDKATAAVGKMVAPTVIRFYNELAKALGGVTQSVADATSWFQWLDTAMVVPQLRLQGYTDAQIAATMAIRGNTYVSQGNASEQYVLSRVYGDMTGAATKQATALNVSTAASKGNSSAANQLKQDQDKLKTATDSLKNSFLSIASAQRDVTRTREALEDATNPDTLQSYQNAADRAYYSNQLLTNEITRMGNRQKAVRAQLAKGNLTQELRNELQIEDAQLTEDLIGKNIDAKDSIISLRKAQKDLDRARDPERIQQYADAHTTAMLRLSELNEKQVENIDTINDLNTKLGANVDVLGLVGQAAALTATPLDGLNTIGGDLNKTYGAATTGVNALLTTTSMSIAAIGQSSGKAATGLGDVNAAMGGLSAVDASKVSGISTLATAFGNLGSAATALRTIDFGTILGGVSAAAASLTASTVTQWGALGVSLNAVAAALAAINKANKDAGTGSGGGSGGGTTTETDVKNRIKSAFSDKFLDLGEYNALNDYAGPKGVSINTMDSWITDFLKTAGKDYRTFNEPVFGQVVGPTPIMGGVGGTGPIAGGAPVSQTINITLNYATPPDSKDPLKDVQDYITAQGGLLRI